MKFLLSVYRCWDRFWFREVPSHSIAAFRILTGIYLLFRFLDYVPHVELFFSNQGAQISYGIPDFVSLSPLVAWCFWGISCVLIVLFIVGYKVRWIAPILFLSVFFHVGSESWSRLCSDDSMLLLFLFLMLFVDSGKTWSINSKNTNHKVPVCIQRLITIYMVWFYTNTGIAKFIHEAWYRYDFMEHVMTTGWATPLAFWIVGLGLPQILFFIAAKGIIIFELTWGLGLLLRRLRLKIGSIVLNISPIQYVYMALGIFFHTMVGLTLSLPEFLFCTCTYVLFLPPRIVQCWGLKIYKKMGEVYKGVLVSLYD